MSRTLLQAVILKDPAELGITETTGGAREVEMVRPTQWHPLPEPTPAAADAVLQDLGMRRTTQWLVQSGDQAPRLLFVANLQRLPQWL